MPLGEIWWEVCATRAVVVGTVPFMFYETTLDAPTDRVKPNIKFVDAIVSVDGEHIARKDWIWEPSINAIIFDVSYPVETVVTALLNLLSDYEIENLLKIIDRDTSENIKSRVGQIGEVWVSSDSGTITSPSGEGTNIEPDDGVAWAVSDTYPQGWTYIGRITAGSQGVKVLAGLFILKSRSEFSVESIDNNCLRLFEYYVISVSKIAL